MKERDISLPSFLPFLQLKDSNYELADKERLYSQINLAYRNLEVELDQRSKVVEDLEMLLQQTEERSNQIIAELQAVKTDASKTVQVRQCGMRNMLDFGFRLSARLFDRSSPCVISAHWILVAW